MAIPYFYNKQIRRHVLQFMAIFANMQVSVGANENNEPRLAPVPITYGHKDRVAASIKSDHTQNKLLRLPVFSAYLNNIQPAPDLRKGTNVTQRQSYMPAGGALPDDIKVVYWNQATPFRCNMDLGIYTSNTDQMFQILEQIFVLFNPLIQIQTSDGPFDYTKITSVELNDVRNESNYQSGTDRRIVQYSLGFTMPIYLTGPVDVRDNYIKEIKVRIGVIDNADVTSQDIIADLDAQGIDYSTIFNAGEDLDLK